MLFLCRACQRHIKSTECPFCGAREHAPLVASPPGSARLSRAQLLAGAAVLGAVSVSACGNDAGVPFYGSPASDEPSTSSSSSGASIPPGDSGSGGSSSGSLYGGPPADLDASADAADEHDASDTDAGDADAGDADAD